MVDGFAFEMDEDLKPKTVNLAKLGEFDLSVPTSSQRTQHSSLHPHKYQINSFPYQLRLALLFIVLQSLKLFDLLVALPTT